MDEQLEQEQRNIFRRITFFFSDLFNIKEGLDWLGTVASIRKKVALKGENMWMLICSVLIASVGLNLDSGAVIIGAMLISPLMSPILGIGLGIGINDRELMLKAFKNFSIATGFAILTSVIYFKFLTPFHEPGKEIISRTSPTILDAIVAIFGGVAGIVATSRKDKGAAIPGVAIATALLPPLAVAGYGLAHGLWAYFFKSFYLFFLNSTLIALATFLIVRYLKFPPKEHLTSEAKSKANLIIASFVILSLIPSVLILSQLIRENRQNAEVNSFFQQNFDSDENRIFGGNFKEFDEGDTIYYSLSYSGIEYDSLQIANLENELSTINNKVSLLDPTFLELSREERLRYERESNQISEQMKEQNQKEALYKQQIQELQSEVDELSTPYRRYNEIESEIYALWPDIDEFSFGITQRKRRQDSLPKEVYTLVVDWSDGLSRSEKREQVDQLNRYIEANFSEELILIER